MELSTQQKGIVTEMRVATYLLNLGYNVSQPFCQDSKYDLILDVNGKLLRLQVKTARMSPDSNSSIVFNCRSTTCNTRENKRRAYSDTEIDYFATWWNDRVCLIPVSQCSSEKRLHLNPTNRKDWCFIEDYYVEGILKTL